MSLTDRIIPAEALRWGALTRSWWSAITVSVPSDRDLFVDGVRILRLAPGSHDFVFVDCEGRP